MMNSQLHLLDSENPSVETEIALPPSPYSALFHDCLEYAREAKASDVHFQPSSLGLDIRIRVNGDMLLWKELSQAHQQNFTNEVKRLSGLSIAISGRAQDGRASFKNMSLDVRSSLLPTQHGEKIVLRLLDLTRDFSINNLEIPVSTKNDLKRLLDSESGIIFVSGPTGSGKTTSLYSILNSLDKKRLNIITVEDPVEYSFAGLTQVQVNAKLTFSDALRGILRQDPDVILIGEIRDKETAELAIKAALTGHLVLSTVHANNSIEVISRLINFGIDPYLIKTCLKFSAAQRLSKCLCKSCSKPPSEIELAQLAERFPSAEAGPFDISSLKVRNEIGCPKCFEGFVGRSMLLEYLTNDEILNWTGDLKGLENLLPRTSLSNEIFRKTIKGEFCALELLKI